MMTVDGVMSDIRAEAARMRREGEALILGADQLDAAVDEAVASIARIDMADAR